MRNTPLSFVIERIKIPVLATVLLAFWSCSNPDANTNALQAKVDSLNKQVAQIYKPGLGEFMLGIQIHHAKLYFAGKNQNWKLADFEMGEIKEAVDDIKKYCTDRPEVKSLSILYPALDSVNNAIKLKSLHHFETRAGCHRHGSGDGIYPHGLVGDCKQAKYRRYGGNCAPPGWNTQLVLSGRCRRHGG